MNMTAKLKSVFAGAMALAATVATAETTVTVGEVTTGEPWSTITVNYTLNGVDEATEYKVAFDVTAGGKTAGVTNEAMTLVDGVTLKQIDTVELFGRQIADAKAKVKVSLIALKPKAAAGVQLWKDGPYWAECNIGATKPEDYGELYTFNDNKAADAAKTLGGDWRLPTKDELEKLANASYCTKEWDSVNKGYTFTGATEGYKDKSIFLPAAGCDYGDGREDAGDEGLYWSSEEGGGNDAWRLRFYEGNAGLYDDARSFGLSVRAVRGSAE